MTTALTAYTAGSAWLNHLEETTGTIEVGKAADLAVIDRDVRATPEAIAAGNVVATYVDGREVYAS